MFRSRKSSKTETVHTSSLSSGNASIKRPEAPVVVVQEHQPRYYSSEPSSYEEYNEDEIIDLQATPAIPTSNELTIESMSAVIAAAVQMSSAGGAPSSLSLGSASILQPFSKTENVAATKNDMKRRFSTRLFSWSNKKSNSPTSPTSPTSTPATPALEPSSPFDSTSNFTMMDDDNSSQGSPRTSSASASSPRKSSCVPDDGRDELMYRGIQIKEIKTTLKTLVISDEVRCPMPEVRLERPGFARINY
ncbi:unnamed protein product [Mucor hiemalis]